MVRLPPRLRPLFPVLKPVVVAATRAVAPTSQWLSRRGTGLLPTGSAATLADAAVPDGRCAVARPAERIVRPPMQGVPAGLRLADRRDGDSVEAVRIAELPGGRVLGPHRAVITGDGRLVHEVSRYFGTRRPREHPMFLNPRPPGPLPVTGRLGVLATRGDANYYHFLIDALPRIALIAQAGWEEPERYYVPAGGPAFRAELLELFGIGPERIVDADVHPHVRAESLIVPGLPATIEKNPPWIVEFLRAQLLAAAGAATASAERDIYVTRGTARNNRAVVDEPALITALTDRGFEAVDPGAMTVRDQIRTFAGARRIVAAHGAALANLVFASPGADVIELFPAGCVLPDYWRLASGVPGLRYRFLSDRGGPRRPTRGSTIVRDIDVDLPALLRLLETLSSAS